MLSNSEPGDKMMHLCSPSTPQPPPFPLPLTTPTPTSADPPGQILLCNRWQHKSSALATFTQWHLMSGKFRIPSHVNVTSNFQYLRLAHPGAFWHVDGVGGVGELRWPEASQYEDRGVRPLPALQIHGLDGQRVLLTRGQGSARGPHFSCDSIYFKWILPTCHKK